MKFRARFSVAGGHVHLRVFSARHSHATFAKLGDLCVTRGPEFVELLAAMGGVEFIPDEGSTMREATEQ